MADMLRLAPEFLTQMQPSSHPTSLDFALLQQSATGGAPRNRRTLWWILGLMALVVASVVGLVVYLEAFESEEEERRRVADGQWLEQSVRFHFNRLEEDLVLLARRAVQPSVPGSLAPEAAAQNLQGGLLWSQPGAVLTHGWLPNRPDDRSGQRPTRWLSDQDAHPGNAEALSSMLDIAAGLRRSAYAGPMRRADGTNTSVVWLAMPYFERGELVGNYVAALSMDECVQGLVPTWFRQNHTVSLVNDGAEVVNPAHPGNAAYLAPMNLPGADLFIEVAPQHAQPAMVPRLFLLVALLFLTGMLVALFALRRDIGKRQRVQALLQAQVALRTAMENSVTIGLRAWDRNGTILYVNEAFCRMVGHASADLVGKNAPFVYWPAGRTDELNAVHQGIIAQGTHHTGVEVQFQHRDGHLVDVLIHEAPLSTADGEQIGWMSSVMDISERKRAQRLAEQQQDKLEASGRLVAMGEVASTLAHELNQPLGALSSFANGLLNRLRSHSISLDELEPVVERMARLSDKAGSIIQRVNAFARRRELSRQHLDLAPFLRRTVGSQPDSKDVQLTLQAGSKPAWVDADEMLLEHVVNNLVSNAQDWAPRSKRPAQVRVWLEHHPTEQRVALCVADSGPGVPEEQRQHIFSAFFSTKDGGMGMGLAICRSIVEAHHGHLEVSQDLDLGGARFTAWLPLTSAPVPHLPDQEQDMP